MKLGMSDKLEKVDGCILPVWQKKKEDGKKAGKAPKGGSVLPAWAQDAFDAGEFDGAAGQTASMRITPSMKKKTGALKTAAIGAIPDTRLVIFLGIGEKGKVKAHALISSYANAFNALKNARCKSISLLLPDGDAGMKLEEFVSVLSSQLVMADYAFDKYKPEEKEGPKKAKVEEVKIVTQKKNPALASHLSQGVIMGEAANLARSIQNEPSNVATPQYVANEAKKMAKAGKLKCMVLGKKQLQKEKMNAMLAVASGSMLEPKLVLLEYRGNPARKGWDVAVVGKGVTFDSGGISIKPSPKMDEMKFDKSGACASLGVLSACKKLGLKLNVVGVAALVENMPSGSAYKPGDIVRACNNKTIEVLNTDAEGRVVLADALAYTAKKFEPDVMMDFATLTGACVVALGDLASGILSENDELVERIEKSADRVGERVWRLPLWSEYDEKVKSEIASLKNIGESGQAGITAGASFLKPFAGEKAWAHIDIAGTANSAKPKGGLCAGGTGVGVRLALDYLMNYQAPKKKKKE